MRGLRRNTRKQNPGRAANVKKPNSIGTVPARKSKKGFFAMLVNGFKRKPIQQKPIQQNSSQQNSSQKPKKSVTFSRRSKSSTRISFDNNVSVGQKNSRGSNLPRKQRSPKDHFLSNEGNNRGVRKKSFWQWLFGRKG